MEERKDVSFILVPFIYHILWFERGMEVLERYPRVRKVSTQVLSILNDRYERKNCRNLVINMNLLVLVRIVLTSRGMGLHYGNKIPASIPFYRHRGVIEKVIMNTGVEIQTSVSVVFVPDDFFKHCTVLLLRQAT